MTERSLLFLGTPEDEKYKHYLKPHMKGSRCFVDLKSISTITEVELYAKNPKRGITGVISTSATLLKRITGREDASINNYSGSYFKRNGLEYVFIDPLEQAVTVPYGDFLLSRYTSKLVSPESWFRTPTFNWCVLTPRNCDAELAILSSPNCIAIACDIETLRDPLAIRCIGFTAVLFVDGKFLTRSTVLPLSDEWALNLARKIANLPAPKIFQNGKYDNAYCLRFNIIFRNWLWDTKTMFHSWYSELPKDLAFIQAFFVREAAYWKDLAESTDLETYYLYNAKDTWATACAFLVWFLEAPEWAKNNYLMEFPVLYPSLLMEMTGVKRDTSRKPEAHKELENMVESRRAELDRLLGTKGFNPNSPKQTSALFKILGCGDLGSTDDKAMAKAIYRHPLNRRILGVIRGIPKSDDVQTMGIRALRKVQGTYLGIGEDDKDFNGRWLYSINPDATDTGRANSAEHAFWCGQNVQNVPVGKIVKQTVLADDDFFFGECDLSKAETWDTAHITGDRNLLAAVTSPRDFHAHNAEAFFGVAYETIYDDKTGRTLNKPLRNTAKRVNHGANYNMGPDVLVDTMGEEALYLAAKVLKLPRNWSAREIAEYLLGQFDKTYPTIRSREPGGYHEWIIAQVKTFKKLVGPTGWTRYCFSDPSKSKRAMNIYAAHNPQSLNAKVLNEAKLRVFYDIAINPQYRRDFMFHADIHDSLFFSYKAGCEFLADMVKERMEIAVRCKDIRGVERVFTVPADLKIGIMKDGVLVRAKYWSETE